MEQNDEIKAKSEINLRKLMQKMGMGTNAFATALEYHRRQWHNIYVQESQLPRQQFIE